MNCKIMIPIITEDFLTTYTSEINEFQKSVLIQAERNDKTLLIYIIITTMIFFIFTLMAIDYAKKVKNLQILAFEMLNSMSPEICSELS